MSGTTDMARFGKVAVLYGGESAEREISLMTGAAVHSALADSGVDAVAVDTRDVSVTELLQRQFTRAWIALHGRGGEDGSMQGALETLRIPYTGSGVLGSALAMDKVRSKIMFEAAGLATPAWCLPRTEAALQQVAQVTGFPCVVKPAHEGSSVGVTPVHDESALTSAWRTAGAGGDEVLVERLIDGDEYTAGVLGDEVLPLIRVETPRTFYDYTAKYFSDTTQYHCPCGLPPDRERLLAEQSLAAFRAVGASGWGRADFMLGRDGTAYFLEINTIPGMTSHSLVPMAAARAGIDFDALVLRILETSFANGELT